MFPPNKDSRFFQDSSLNRTPRENFYISGYEGQNEISQDVPERERPEIYVVIVLDPGEPVTLGSLYNFAMLNIPETSHLGKTLMSTNWRNQFW